MAEPFLSEIKIVSFGFAPRGWAMCNGQTMPINQNQALFSLLGTTYGGNGQTTFALPDFRGSVPIHAGNGHTLGEAGGQVAVTLGQSEMPQHTHMMQATTAGGDTTALADNFLAEFSNGYAPPTGPRTTLLPATVQSAGGSLAHSNMMPFLVLNFVIALQGIYPSRN